MRWMRELRRAASVLLAAALVACAARPRLRLSLSPASAGSQDAAPQSAQAAPGRPASRGPGPAAPAPAPGVRGTTATTVQVPAQLRRGAFSQDRQLQIAEGFSISVFALVPDARSLTLAPWGEILVSQPGGGAHRRPAGRGRRRRSPRPSAPSSPACSARTAWPSRTTTSTSPSPASVDRFRHNGGEAFGVAERVVGELPPVRLRRPPLPPPHLRLVGRLLRRLRLQLQRLRRAGRPPGLRLALHPGRRGGRVRPRAAQRRRPHRQARQRSRSGWPRTSATPSGDNIPPEPITAISPGQNYGWPFCYWNGSVLGRGHPRPGAQPRLHRPDPVLRPPRPQRPPGDHLLHPEPLPRRRRRERASSPCTAPGTTARGVGFKLVRIPFADGAPQPAQDFVSGWLTGNRAPESAWGRPVDVQEGPDGALYLSDDRAGAIYRIAYTGVGLRRAAVAGRAGRRLGRPTPSGPGTPLSPGTRRA